MKRLTLVLLAVTVCGCGTFTRMKPDYTDLPVEELKTLASAIEQAVANGEREPELPNTDSINVDNEELMQAIRIRAVRHPLIDGFLDTGHAWERRDGHIWILRTKEYKKFGTRQDRNRNALLVNNEVQNRWTLYEGLIKHNNFNRKSLGAIQEAFFEARVELMKSGQKYEGPDGETIVKD